MPATFQSFTWLLFLAWHSVLQGQDLQAPQWREDLDFFAQQLPTRHINPFSHVTPAEFHARVEKIKSSIESSSDRELIRDMMRLVTSLRDSHTVISYPATQLHGLPLQFYSFADGVYVVGAREGFQDALGAKLVRIGRLSADELLERLAEVLPHENKWGLRHLSGRHMSIAETLHVIGAWERPNAGTVELIADDGPIQSDCDAIPVAELRAQPWHTRTGETPLFARKPQLSHWNDWLPDSKTLYFKYNRCQDSASFSRLARGTAAFIDQNPVDRFVLDLRNNPGGDSRVAGPLIEYLRQSEFASRDRLFVIIGRQTFSSAILNALQLKQLGAILVGEPTGGAPNHFGEVKHFTLKHSGLLVTYSTKRFQHAGYEGLDSLMPDIRVKTTFTQWWHGEDPALDACLGKLEAAAAR